MKNFTPCIKLCKRLCIQRLKNGLVVNHVLLFVRFFMSVHSYNKVHKGYCSKNVSKWIHLCNCYPGQHIEHYQHSRLFPHALSQLTLPKVTTILTFITIDFLKIILEVHKNEIIQCVLCVLLLLLILFLWDSSMWLHYSLFLLLYTISL